MEFDEHSIKLDLAQRIAKIKDSTSQLSGSELISAHKIISSISDRPFEFKISGPVKVVPWDITTSLAGPIAAPAEDEEIVLSGVMPSHSATATIACPKCGHAVKVKLSCE